MIYLRQVYIKQSVFYHHELNSSSWYLFTAFLIHPKQKKRLYETARLTRKSICNRIELIKNESFVHSSKVQIHLLFIYSANDSSGGRNISQK